MTRSLVVVSAGLRQPSSTRLLADRLAAATTAALAERGEAADTTTIELRDHAQDLVNNLLTGFGSERLEATIDRVLRADGLIAVSPVFNASFSGLFKVFFDVIEADALRAMPVLIGATGGTARHSLMIEHAMRPLFAYLGALPVPTGVFAASEDWGQAEMPADAGLAERIERAADQLAAAIVLGERPVRRDPFSDPIDLGELLARRPPPG